jgi:hypothetical protein
MLNNISNKKILCNFNDFSNKGFINFLIKISKRNKITIITRNVNAKKFFKNTNISFKYLKDENNNKLFRFINFFAKIKKSNIEKFYHIENLLFNYNILRKPFYFIKLFFFYTNIGIKKNSLRKFFLNKKKIVLNYDLLLVDFRFNEIYTNHNILYAAINAKIRIYSIVFSWDNIFSADVNLISNKYYVQSNFLKKEISSRHKIEMNKIDILKPFQFDYIDKNLKFKLNKKNKKKYILFVCCTEDNSRASIEEFSIINHIGEYLIKNKSNIIIKVRPYPYLSRKSNLNKRIKFKNIFIENYGSLRVRRIFNNKIEYMRYEKNDNYKYELIRNSIAVINFFSTMGIESVLIKKFTLFLNIKFDNLSFFQYLKSNTFKVKFLDHYKFLENRKTYLKTLDKLDTNLDLIINKDNNIKYNISDYLYFKKIFYN